MNKEFVSFSLSRGTPVSSLFRAAGAIIDSQRKLRSTDTYIRPGEGTLYTLYTLYTLEEQLENF